jgi:hypothetical protein
MAMVFTFVQLLFQTLSACAALSFTQENTESSSAASMAIRR